MIRPRSLSEYPIWAAATPLAPLAALLSLSKSPDSDHSSALRAPPMTRPRLQSEYSNRLLAWCAGLLLTAVSVGNAHERDVDIQQIEYKGWTGAYEITNGDARVVVVPQIGRIMHYSLTGGQNMLWNNPDLLGQILPANGPPINDDGELQWQNFGGDKVWSNEQDDFEAINDHSWPPDHWFDGSPQQVERLEQGIRITSPVSPANGARVIRDISLTDTGTRLRIAQRLEKVQAARHPALEPLTYTIWNVTQIRPPQVTLMPLNPHSGLPGRFRLWDDTSPASFVADGDIGLFTPHTTDSQKAGVDSDRWLAGIVGDVVIAEFYRRDATQRYPDGGLSAEVYTSVDYTELELLSPLVPLQPGDHLELVIEWELHPLPDTATTDTERVRAATGWLLSQKPTSH